MMYRYTARRRFLVGLVVSAVLSVISSSAFAEKAKSSQETILFLGDSITRGGGYVRAIDAALRKKDRDNPPRVINRGRSSETVSGLSESYHPGVRPSLFARLDKELESAKPDWVVACYPTFRGF